MFDYSSIAGFGALGGMGGQGQSAFGSSVVPMPSFDAGSYSLPGSAMGQQFNFPSVGAPGGAGAGSGFGFNAPTAQLALGGLQALGNLWGGIQANKMAKKQFKFSKNMALTNLANQVKSYNTALADRARGRAVMESQSDATRDAYVRDNSLSTNRNDERRQVQ